MLRRDLPTVQRVQPTFIEPMQVLPVCQLPDGGNWTYEAKLDGYRCLVARRKRGTALWSRRGTIFTARFPKIVWACEKLPPDTLRQLATFPTIIPYCSVHHGLACVKARSLRSRVAI